MGGLDQPLSNGLHSDCRNRKRGDDLESYLALRFLDQSIPTNQIEIVAQLSNQAERMELASVVEDEKFRDPAFHRFQGEAGPAAFTVVRSPRDEVSQPITDKGHGERMQGRDDGFPAFAGFGRRPVSKNFQDDRIFADMEASLAALRRDLVELVTSVRVPHRHLESRFDVPPAERVQSLSADYDESEGGQPQPSVFLCHGRQNAWKSREDGGCEVSHPPEDLVRRRQAVHYGLSVKAKALQKGEPTGSASRGYGDPHPDQPVRRADADPSPDHRSQAAQHTLLEPRTADDHRLARRTRRASDEQAPAAERGGQTTVDPRQLQRFLRHRREFGEIRQPLDLRGAQAVIVEVVAIKGYLMVGVSDQTSQLGFP